MGNFILNLKIESNDDSEAIYGPIDTDTWAINKIWPGKKYSFIVSDGLIISVKNIENN